MKPVRSKEEDPPAPNNALPAPLNPTTSVSITPNDDRYNEEKENNPYVQLGKALAMDALAVTWGTLVWVWVYFFVSYFRFVEDYDVPGYIVGCLLEGFFSNFAAYYLVRQGLIYGGLSPEEATAKTRRYLWKYLPIDSSYQAMEGLAVMLGGNGWHFEMLDDPVYTVKEVLSAVGVFWVGDAALYMSMSRLLGERVTVREAVTVGAQYFIFYSTDYYIDYNLDMDTDFNTFLLALVKKTPELSLGAAAVGSAAFIMNFVQEAIMLWWERSKQVVDASLSTVNIELPRQGSSELIRAAENPHVLFAARNFSSPAPWLSRSGYARIQGVQDEEEEKKQIMASGNNDDELNKLTA